MSDINELDILQRFPGHTLQQVVSGGLVTYNLLDGGSTVIASKTNLTASDTLRSLRTSLVSDAEVVALLDSTDRAAVTSVLEGQLAIDPDDGDLYKFDGTVWAKVDSGGGGGGADMFGPLTANNALFPSANSAGASSRNEHPVLVFDDTTSESVVFSSAISRDYSGVDVIIDIDWVAETATTGGVTWGVEIERLNAGGPDIDSDSFNTQQTGTSTTNATSGIITRTSITLTNAQADAWAAGDSFRLRLQRVTSDGGDTMTGDAQVLRVIGRQ